MMKRIWALLLGVVLSVSLTACAENNLDQMYIEEAQLTGQGDASVAQTFHETFNGLYTEFLDTLFEEILSNRKD